MFIFNGKVLEELGRWLIWVACVVVVKVMYTAGEWDTRWWPGPRGWECPAGVRACSGYLSATGTAPWGQPHAPPSPSCCAWPPSSSSGVLLLLLMSYCWAALVDAVWLEMLLSLLLQVLYCRAAIFNDVWVRMLLFLTLSCWADVAVVFFLILLGCYFWCVAASRFVSLGCWCCIADLFIVILFGCCSFYCWGVPDAALQRCCSFYCFAELLIVL